MLLSPCDEASDSPNCDQSTYDDSWILVKEVTHFQELMSHSKIYVSKHKIILNIKHVNKCIGKTGLGAVHILRKHILGSPNTLGGVVSTW